MELRQLQYLVAVADEAGFTRAAQRLHLAQPGLSAQIGRLEREVGHRLFERTPRGATPTEAGAVLIARARAVLAAVDDARAALDELTGLVRGSVAVGLVRGVPLGGLVDTLGRFRRAHPGVSITLLEDESTSLLTRLQDGTLDLALVGLAGPAVPALTTRTVTDDRLVAMVPGDDPWAGRRAVDLTAVASRAVVLLPRGTGMRDAFDGACRRAGVTATVAFEVSRVATAVELVRAGLGVAVVPATAARATDAHATAVPATAARATHARATDAPHVVRIVRPVVHSRLAIAWRTSAAAHGRPAARALIAAVDAQLRAAPRRPPGVVTAGD